MSFYFRTFAFTMEKLLNDEQLHLLQEKIERAARVACVCHVNPDGDAMGSTLAVAAWMKSLGKECRVVVPTRFPDFLQWMPGASEVLRYDKSSDEADTLLRTADLVWVCDMGEPSRALGMEPLVSECDSMAHSGNGPFMVMIDHHIAPMPGFCNIQISRPEMCATCEVLCHLACQLGRVGDMSKAEATCLYTGMMTDTGAFTYASARSVIYECISMLLSRGIDKDRIYRKVFWTYSPNRMRLVGYLLYAKMELIPGMNTSLITLTNNERRTLGVKNGDTEGIVNMPLQIRGMRLSAFISEDTEHPEYVKFSLRSVDDFPCNEMSARFFGGGGHRNAAGGRMRCTMEEAVELFRRAVGEYESMLR